MPLKKVPGEHIRVICANCGNDAELCGRRELLPEAYATERFLKAGWHHDPPNLRRQHDYEQAVRDGAGKWYCPSCAGCKHL